jgi:1-acyl-sn-glycerol-3-phosphate acyltransferase
VSVLTALRSLAFVAGLALWTLIMGVVGLATLPRPAAVTYRFAMVWAEGALRLLGAICGLRHRIVGAERLPPGPAILAVKHQSAWETIALLRDAPRWAGVLKRELLLIPVYGWYLKRIGMIPIDRAAGAGAMKALLRAARAAISEGRWIMIMPEGTRMPPGRAGRYHPGIAALYGALDVPVVPVALNSGLFWSRRSLAKRPGTITLEFLDPIAPGLDRAAFMAVLQERLETASNRLIETGIADGAPRPAP